MDRIRLVKRLQSRLEEKADAKTKAWWEAYLKQAIPFRGVKKEGEACARRISEWRTADNLWRRRASGVAFVELAKNGDENFAGFTDILLQICESTVRHPERFSQTGTGWVLRELSIAEPQRVQDFVGAHVCEFSTEGLRYALGKLSPAAQDSLRRMRAACNAPS